MNCMVNVESAPTAVLQSDKSGDESCDVGGSQGDVEVSCDMNVNVAEVSQPTPKRTSSRHRMLPRHLHCYDIADLPDEVAPPYNHHGNGTGEKFGKTHEGHREVKALKTGIGQRKQVCSPEKGEADGNEMHLVTGKRKQMIHRFSSSLAQDNPCSSNHAIAA